MAPMAPPCGLSPSSSSSPPVPQVHTIYWYYMLMKYYVAANAVSSRALRTITIYNNSNKNAPSSTFLHGLFSSPWLRGRRNDIIRRTIVRLYYVLFARTRRETDSGTWETTDATFIGSHAKTDKTWFQARLSLHAWRYYYTVGSLFVHTETAVVPHGRRRQQPFYFFYLARCPDVFVETNSQNAWGRGRRTRKSDFTVKWIYVYNVSGDVGNRGILRRIGMIYIGSKYVARAVRRM